MSSYDVDVLVVGGGTGRDVVVAAEEAGLRVALVEKGPLGGTCHNRGCMPSKMLIHSADLADAIREAAGFGVHSSVDRVDFPTIVHDVFHVLDEETREREESLRASNLVTFFQREGRFTDAKSMQVGDDVITADRVVIAAGSRPAVVPIPGLDEVPYITSDEALHLEALPERLAIIGGGYISCELAHFFGSLGAEITILEVSDRLMAVEDAEVGEWLTREYASKYRVLTGARTERVSQRGDIIEVQIKGEAAPIVADKLLVATGRQPNSDMLGLDATGIELDGRGHIAVNEYLETNVEGVGAFGDITGVLPLKHVAVRQARHLARNLFHGDRRPMDYAKVPHAAFSSPQVAAVGQTEQQLRDAGVPHKVGRWRFKDTGMGMALRADGLVKVLASPEHDILGCHIVGPYASILIHEAVVAMNGSAKLDAIVESVHAHPALPQVLEEACRQAQVAEVIS